MAPTTHMVELIFNPEKIYGRALGNRIFMKICHWLAFKYRTKSKRSSSTSSRPVAVLMTIGKKETRKAIRILVAIPYPIHRRKIGATAMMGREFTKTKKGSSRSRILFDQEIRMAM